MKTTLDDTRRICLVTSELAGPDYNGGIGTAVRGLALSLVRHGYDVDVLYTRVDHLKPHCFRGSFQEQVEAYRKLKVNLLCLAHDGTWNDWLGKSYQVMVHLADQPYDLVFFNDMHAEGYYSLLGRATAHPRLSRTTMAVVLHSSTQWIAELNQQAVTTLDGIRLMEMERRCVELADAVISPSAYMLKKYESYGWKLPENAQVIPNLLPMESQGPAVAIRTRPVDEIVFFGRLERRKGLWLFCKAIDRIKNEFEDLRITFLGKLTEEDGESIGYSLLKRSAAWPFEFKLLGDFDREQALNYLKAGRRVAVMPAPEDNSPCAILECLYEGIPFVAASGSGGQELVAKESWDDNLFEPNVEALSQKLRLLIQHGGRNGRPSTRPQENEEALMNWLEHSITKNDALPEGLERSDARESPSVRTPSYHIVLLAISRRNPERDVVQIQSATALHPATVRVTVVTADRDAVAERLSRVFEDRPIDVIDIQNFEDFLRLLARDSLIVGFCHVTEPITPEWLERAGQCYREAPDVVALTGLAAARGPVLDDFPGWFRPLRSTGKVREYIIGNAAALFPLAMDTNDGFIAMRPEVISKIADISPFDGQYDRFKSLRDWVHEIVVRLARQGERFEVLVDPVIDASLDEEPSLVGWSGRVSRSLAGASANSDPGSEEALLVRLAVETQVGRRKKANAAACLAVLPERLGRRLDDPALYGSEEHLTRTLAAMARASGQTELAHELIADHLLSRRDGQDVSHPISSLVRQRSREVRLFDLVAAGAFSAFNLTHDWSLKVISADREVEVHPNTYFEGRATLSFSNLDLTDLEFLQGAIRVASPLSGPVRFRIDILSEDGFSRFSLERVVEAGEALDLKEPLPPEVRTCCSVRLSTEMESPMDRTEDAWARWVDLRLVGSSTPSVKGETATVLA